MDKELAAGGHLVKDTYNAHADFVADRIKTLGETQEEKDLDEVGSGDVWRLGEGSGRGEMDVLWNTSFFEFIAISSPVSFNIVVL